MGRSGIVLLAAVVVLGGAAAAQAGPCTTRILQLEQQLKQLQRNPAPSGAGEPTAPQSLGAQLHHQPTPESVEHAAGKASADAAAALERARKADAEGDAAACAKALEEAKQLYGLE